MPRDRAGREPLPQILQDLSWVEPLRSQALTPVFQAVTRTGSPLFYAGVLAVGYLAVHRTVFSRLAVLLACSALVNGLLKDVLADPRPSQLPHLDPSVAGSFGMPSGHAQNGLVVWCFLAWVAGRRWLWALAVWMVAAVSFSRLYLGVHDLEDVLLGWVVGASLLAGFMRWLPRAREWWYRRRTTAQFALLLALQLGLALIWPGDTGRAFAMGGLLTGWWLSMRADRAWIGYQVPEATARRVGAAVTGAAGTLAAALLVRRAAHVAGLGEVASAYLQLALAAVMVGVVVPTLFRQGAGAGEDD